MGFGAKKKWDMKSRKDMEELGMYISKQKKSIWEGYIQTLWFQFIWQSGKGKIGDKKKFRGYRGVMSMQRAQDFGGSENTLWFHNDGYMSPYICLDT